MLSTGAIASDQSLIERSRTRIRKTLDRMPKIIKESTKDAAIDFICDEIRKLPIPILSTALASTIKKLSKSEDRKASIDDVIAILEEMQKSNEDFERVLRSLNISLTEIFDEINALKAFIQTQFEPRLNVVKPRVELNYPVEDNAIKMILANTGGGTVIVDEIFIDIEKWEPLPEVDFSVPAAPLPDIVLEVQLSINELIYPLFELNNEPSHAYHAQGNGAERIIINASSSHNAEYWVRLRIPYFDLSTGHTNTLYYPEPPEEPIRLPYTYAPGWNSDIKTEKLLSISKIYEKMAEKFEKVTEAFRDYHSSGEEEIERVMERLDELGIYPITISSFLHRFIPPYLKIAYLEEKQEALGIVLNLLAYYFEPYNEEFTPSEIVSTESFIIANGEIAPYLNDFLDEKKIEQRIELTQKIMSKID